MQELYLIAKKKFSRIFLTIFSIIFFFGCIYNYLYKNGHDFQNFKDSVDPWYYSTVVTFTVGFGDIVPTTTIGKLVTIVQVVLFWSLISIFNIYIVKKK